LILAESIHVFDRRCLLAVKLTHIAANAPFTPLYPEVTKLMLMLDFLFDLNKQFEHLPEGRLLVSFVFLSFLKRLAMIQEDQFVLLGLVDTCVGAFVHRHAICEVCLFFS
jgi:hypothetical protein